MYTKAFFTAAFFIFLFPVTIAGLSVNYSFLLFPVFTLLFVGRLKRPKEGFLLLMGLYVLIFIVASLYQWEFHDESIRRILSFLLFMSMFSYMFLQIHVETAEAFKRALVAVSLFLSVYAIVTFFLLGGASLGFDAKDEVGSQRVGFLYLFAFWIVLLDDRLAAKFRPLRFSFILILLAGLFLTFSRSSLIALVVSILLYSGASCIRWFCRPTFGTLLRSIVPFSAAVLVIVVLYHVFPVAFDFFNDRLVSYLLNSDTVSRDLSNPESSGGTRIFLWRSIIDFVSHHPFTGSGYLGVWVALGEGGGSAHNQYADVLFRTGVFGFVAYLGLLIYLSRFLRVRDIGLFWGLVAVLVYGMFHETFKESHGTFVLAFLLGMWAQSLRVPKSAVPT